MRSGIEIIVAIAGFLAMVAAECPNACSAHGKCGAYDMCTCYRNWMSNDCSERICQFGLAHVDTPKGDLDSSSGSLSGPGTKVIVNSEMYPCGTTEQYPAATESDGTVLTNYAHEYRECSNKGICDRTSGTCACFNGYDGTACQRASCPSSGGAVCSGHGTCQTIKEIAEADFGNMYHLWDQHSTMGCVCDGGYSGADCSERMCKTGADPLYFDEVSTARYSNYTYQFYVKSPNVGLSGNYSLVFTDAHNEEWTTNAIGWNATCTEVQAALESLPNNVIPFNSVRCFKSDQDSTGAGIGQELGTGGSTVHNPAVGDDGHDEPIYDANMYVKIKFTVAFSGNPGRLPQLKINTYLDGTRPTLFSDETTSSLGWHVYPNGFIGEDVDMVNDYCEGVTVNLNVGTATHYLSGLDAQEAKALKRCLGDANGDETDNVEVYNWDYGNMFNPHLIKLVDGTQYYGNTLPEGECFDDCTMDQILRKFPSSQLCDSSSGNKAKFGGDGYGINFCSNKNPAGFYAVIFYDAVISATNPFRIYTRAAHDYSSATEFFVFTTKGYLNLVSRFAAGFTNTYEWGNAAQIKSHYSNVVHMTNFSTGNSPDQYPGYLGNIDCETNPIGSNGARDCLNKNDHVMIFGTSFNSYSNAKTLKSNPVYPNIYQVKKIFRTPKTYKTDPSNPNSEGMRHQIHLDYSLNSEHVWENLNATASTVATPAQIYKFHPSTANADGGYRWVGQCAQRGLCNTDSGLCQCFNGYTSDNCASINALAQ